MNWYTKSAKKPFATLDVTDTEVEFIKQRAKQEGISVHKFMSDGIGSVLRESLDATCRAFLTPEAAAVADRLVRDHPGLTIYGMVTAGMNEVMSELEEDVADDGLARADP